MCILLFEERRYVSFGFRGSLVGEGLCRKVYTREGD